MSYQVFKSDEVYNDTDIDNDWQDDTPDKVNQASGEDGQALTGDTHLNGQDKLEDVT